MREINACVASWRRVWPFFVRFTLPAFCTYILFYFDPMKGQGFSINGVAFFTVLIRNLCTIFAVIFWAGILGVLAAMVRGHTWTMRLEDFKAGWKYILSVVFAACLPLGMHFVVFLFWPHMMRLEQMVLVCAPVISVYLAGHVLGVPGKGFSILELEDYTLLVMAVIVGLVLEQTTFAVLPFVPELGPLLAFLFILVRVFILYCAFISLAHRGLKNEGRGDYNLVLINPVLSGMTLGLTSALCHNYPMVFSSIRAFTPERYRIIELNKDIWAPQRACGSALVAITCFTTNAGVAYDIARRFRQAGSKVVMGGPHVGLFPQEALEYCDAVVVGPVEGVWEDIISDYEAGRLARVYRKTCTDAHLDRLHAYLLQQSPLVAAQTLMVKRGCKFRCYFCTHSSILDSQPRQVSKMIELLKHIKKVCHAVTFLDSNIYSDPVYAKELLTAMIPLKMKWTGAASLDIARSDETLKLLKASGCQVLLIGYEIPDGSSEAAAGGKLAMSKDYLPLSRKIQAAGIKIKAAFMLGFATDTWKSIFKVWWFCARLRPEEISLSYMSPLPGSAFFDDVVRDNKVIDLNWRSYIGYLMVAEHASFRPGFFVREGYLMLTTLFFFVSSCRGFFFFVVLVMAVLAMLGFARIAGF